MASQKVGALYGETLLVQGFKPGGGYEEPYVHVMLVDAEGFSYAGFDLLIREANELGEVLRQEAERASTAQEGDSNVAG